MAEQWMQGDLFKAETGWFHVFRSFVDSGALASMDGATVKVYLVIKMHTNIESGIAGPLGHETIARKSGIHHSSVKRAIAKLEALGYLSKTSRGRSYQYRFQERWRVHDEAGKQTAVASWPYVPSQVRSTSEDLKAGRIPASVHIERLQVNINHVSPGGLVINVQETLGQLQPNMRRTLASLLAKAGHDVGSYSQLTGELDHE
ncbi:MULTISPECIES: helix-turn-helix domain-containing protein [Ralstonia solanacearum species complex]|uniref:helix-turn-helix domain-containing protein n=1 Tax=Ralstonia solanacearum species complex TaxID=3116862 RepID=UPI000E596FDB|nr:helix-turn-helix domain-containing protein [Ralstonia solanacearum]BEU72581.1 hypothetical protein MAFF211271_21360 [Ralstonia pseudosolanacearum]AXV77436.1 hypothetical protein CJO76_10940 [Ralstonia solanacearum]AXV91456.1 hypothetical protein CJO79_10925 [Ralstonia solanacearum]AXW19580.1 hypothetical protein CJO85_10975 [Ralstonia solanacearum]AXW76352.1 hypothetical protein CJO97_10920 [Ralstonia solanacearum]